MRYLSIDIETSGLWPGMFSLCSIGAVPVQKSSNEWVVEQDRGFYVELQPLQEAGEMPDATNIHGLTSDHLKNHGEEPAYAMLGFEEYLKSLGSFKTAAWPASFDHSWIGWYFQKFLFHNPIGHSGFDIASYAMGLMGQTGKNATFRALEGAGFQPPTNPNPHHALCDATEQAQTLAWLLNYAEQKQTAIRVARTIFGGWGINSAKSSSKI